MTDQVRQHGVACVPAEVLAPIGFGHPVAETILQHHARQDGSGCPRGLKGDETILQARILAVADVVEAISSHRPCRAALGIDAALTEIHAGSGRLCDADVVVPCKRVSAAGDFEFPA